MQTRPLQSTDSVTGITIVSTLYMKLDVCDKNGTDGMKIGPRLQLPWRRTFLDEHCLN